MMAKDALFSGESKNIEYKVALPDKSEKYMKTIVAFANTQGGKLIMPGFSYAPASAAAGKHLVSAPKTHPC